MRQELGPSGLVRRAIERGEGAGDDWDEYRYRLRQARTGSASMHSSAHCIAAVLGMIEQPMRERLQGVPSQAKSNRCIW